MMLNTPQLSKRRYFKIIIIISLLLIIFGYIGNNLFWGRKSPIYFCRDSITNIHWAVYYGKVLSNEGLAYRPDLIKILENNGVKRDSNIYYPEEYSKIFKGPITKKENITIGDLLKFRHPPLWFMFMGGFFAVFGFQIWVIYLAQAILGGITIWLTYLVAKKIHGSGAGLLSAFVLSTLPYFLIITRQGFLEAMVWPMMLIGIMLVGCILDNPLRRIYYLLLGLVCGITLLIKSVSIIFISIFFLLIPIFIDKRKVGFFLLLENLSISIILIMAIVLPWYTYAHEQISKYALALIDKVRHLRLFDLLNISVIVPILKNVQLGLILFILFVLVIIGFCFKPRLKVSYIIAFLACGYLFTTFLPTISVRPYSVFLPLAVMLTCYGIMNLSKFKPGLVFFLVIFGLIRGYGWLFPNFSQLDRMSYFYDSIGTRRVKQKYKIHSTDISSNNIFSSFAPLPPMQQRAIYDKIKKISSSSGLRLVRIIKPDKYALEAKNLTVALSLYSMLESFPLIMQKSLNLRSNKPIEPFKDRILVFLRDVNEDINLSDVNIKRASLKYVASISLSPTISCDIFKEEAKKRKKQIR